ncbi:MAG TPA: terminase family protein [Chitinophagales bacterium]|nr:terminase family protein [Chitinophagales bacterium]
MKNRKIGYTRPANVAGYEKQAAFIDAPERYCIVEASTKVGKTTGCIVWLFEQALEGKEGDNYWWVSPVYSQAKIAFRRMGRFITNKSIYKMNKSELTITLSNGAVIFFKSADNPDLLYGDDVKAVVIDEASRMGEEAWFAVRSTLTKTRGRAKIIGNVKGTANWAYQLARKAEGGQMRGWRYFRITADDAEQAGILGGEESADAARTLPRGVFLELYYCLPNKASSSRFCFAFDEQKHVARCHINNEYPVYLSFDFNRNPICCSVIQHYDNTVFVTHCIKLANSNIYSLCNVLRTKFRDAFFIVTGDSTGRHSNAMVSDNNNYYRIIMQELKINMARMRIPESNPKLEENQVLVNGILEHHKVLIDPENAAALIFDCKFVEALPNGKIIKADRKKVEQQADALDTFRYWCNTFMGGFFEA